MVLLESQLTMSVKKHTSAIAAILILYGANYYNVQVPVGVYQHRGGGSTFQVVRPFNDKLEINGQAIIMAIKVVFVF